MTKQQNNWLTMLGLTLVLTACGGGDGDSGSDTPATNTNVGSSPLSFTASAAASDSGESAQNAEPTPAPSPTPPPEPSVQSINELVIANQNNLSSTYQLTVDVNLSQLNDKQAYIAICEYDQQAIDYDKCFIKAALDDGIGRFDLKLPNHQTSLIAEITPMENGSVPLIFTWQYDYQAQSTWLIP